MPRVMPGSLLSGVFSWQHKGKYLGRKGENFARICERWRWIIRLQLM